MYDVTALFISVPVDSAIQVITAKLEGDDTLPELSALSVQHLTELLVSCLSTTYFIYDGCFLPANPRSCHGIPSVVHSG